MSGGHYTYVQWQVVIIGNITIKGATEAYTGGGGGTNKL